MDVVCSLRLVLFWRPYRAATYAGDPVGRLGLFAKPRSDSLRIPDSTSYKSWCTNFNLLAAFRVSASTKMDSKYDRHSNRFRIAQVRRAWAYRRGLYALRRHTASDSDDEFTAGKDLHARISFGVGHRRGNILCSTETLGLKVMRKNVATKSFKGRPRERMKLGVRAPLIVAFAAILATSRWRASFGRVP